MVETFRTCKRAYRFASLQYRDGSVKARLKSICKRFILKGLAEINRGKLTTTNQVQKFMGQNWPTAKLGDYTDDKDRATRAFLFALKTLTRYVEKPYKPEKAHLAAVALRVRARVPHLRVYVEDTIDLVLWYPDEKRLELVDFQIRPLPHFDPAWPSPEVLIKRHLAEKLKLRWQFEKVTMTFVHCSVEPATPQSVSIDDRIYQVHWAELVKTLEEMKNTGETGDDCEIECAHCDEMEKENVSDLSVHEHYSLTA